VLLFDKFLKRSFTLTYNILMIPQRAGQLL
jgi:hypothetical protein